MYFFKSWFEILKKIAVFISDRCLYLYPVNLLHPLGHHSGSFDSAPVYNEDSKEILSCSLLSMGKLGCFGLQYQSKSIAYSLSHSPQSFSHSSINPFFSPSHVHHCLWAGPVLGYIRDVESAVSQCFTARGQPQLGWGSWGRGAWEQWKNDSKSVMGTGLYSAFIYRHPSSC